MKNLLKKLLRSWSVKKLAKLDAAVGKYLGEERLMSVLGPRQVWDAVQYSDQIFIVDDLQKGGDVVEELQADVHDSDMGSQLPATGILVLGAALFLLVDVIACIQLMILLGVQPAHRVILGVALACILVALTWGLRSVINQTSSGEGRKMPAWTVLVIVGAYALFVVAAAVLRLSDVAVPEEGTTLADWAGAILLVLATAGPAFLAEGCLRALSVSYPQRRQQSSANHQLRAAEARVAGAREHLRQIGSSQREWDSNFSRLKGLYDATFSQKTAKHARLNSATTIDTQSMSPDPSISSSGETSKHLFN